jgi:hypothetical protein
VGLANPSKYADGVLNSFVRMLVRCLAADTISSSAVMAGVPFRFPFKLLGEEVTWREFEITSSSITQSTIGSAIATASMSLGLVRASIVARLAPRWVPMSPILGRPGGPHASRGWWCGKRFGMMSVRMWEKAIEQSWIGCG